MRRIVGLSVVVGVLGWGQVAQAAPIAISNHDFEAPALMDDQINSGLVPGWTKSGVGSSGTFNPFSPVWYLTLLDEDTSITGGEIGTMDGPSVGFFFNAPGAFEQTLADSLVVGSL